jgi:uncharacterized protein YqjF (DUF2071 family)
MESIAASRNTLSEAAQRRMLAVPGEPMFYASWNRALFIHYAVAPSLLQPDVPFELDMREGRAFVSLVAFTLHKMRPRRGGKVGEWLLKPIATHEFLNVRTYVRHQDEPGIYFLAEWLNNFAAVHLGPRSFGLPYRFGRVEYDHRRDGDSLRGMVKARDGELAYQGRMTGDRSEPCHAGSLTEFLLERYTAFTRHRTRDRFFRVWHSPWPQTPAEIELNEDSLVATTCRWWRGADYVGANYSPGVAVWMGRPHRIN